MNLPIIKLEVSGMREQIAMAFTNWQFKQDAMVQEALKQVCTEENVQSIINDAVAKELTHAIEEETKSFFAYGDGRKLVRKLVLEKLSKD